MAGPIRDRSQMIAQMAPVLRPGWFVFCTLPDPGPDLCARAVGTFLEAEGLSLILPEAVARAHGLPCDTPMALITLQVASSLEGVGLTAAVSAALAAVEVPCNVVAAFHHDHVFVPAPLAGVALAALRAIQEAP